MAKITSTSLYKQADLINSVLAEKKSEYAIMLGNEYGKYVVNLVYANNPYGSVIESLGANLTAMECHVFLMGISNGIAILNRKNRNKYYTKNPKVIDISKPYFSPEDKQIIRQLKRDISKYKNKLIKYAKENGIYENFGQKEVRKLMDKYNIYIYDYHFNKLGGYELLRDFDDWASTFDLSKL